MFFRCQCHYGNRDHSYKTDILFINVLPQTRPPLFIDNLIFLFFSFPDRERAFPPALRQSVRIPTGDPSKLTQSSAWGCLPTILRPPLYTITNGSHTDRQPEWCKIRGTEKRRRYYRAAGNSRNHLALNSSRELTFLNSDRCREAAGRIGTWDFQ